MEGATCDFWGTKVRAKSPKGNGDRTLGVRHPPPVEHGPVEHEDS